MIFEAHNGKCFNSINLEHLKQRFGLSHSEYSICILHDGQLYVHASRDSLEACRKKAEKFVRQYHVTVQIYYFERPTADEWCQEFIEEVSAQSAHELTKNQNVDKKVRLLDEDKSIENSTQRYLDFLKNSY